VIGFGLLAAPLAQRGKPRNPRQGTETPEWAIYPPTSIGVGNHGIPVRGLKLEQATKFGLWVEHKGGKPRNPRQGTETGTGACTMGCWLRSWETTESPSGD